MMSMRRRLAITASVTFVTAGVTAVVVSTSDEAHATLPNSLERSMVSAGVERSVEVNVDEARKVTLRDGTDVFLVPGRAGDACIGLESGAAACGPAADVAAGRLFLITVPASGEPRRSAVPATGSTEVVVYGYQPDKRAGRASIRGAEGQELGSADVVDGIYRVEITTDAHSKRMSEVRFDRADDAAAAPEPIDLD
jgi:hypothetical protein